MKENQGPCDTMTNGVQLWPRSQLDVYQLSLLIFLAHMQEFSLIFDKTLLSALCDIAICFYV